MVEAGQFRLLEGAAWSSAYLAELTAFPGGAHDDFVDATVQALTHLRDSPEPNVLVYYRGLVEADRIERQKVHDRAPTISGYELQRYRLEAGVCRICSESLFLKSSIRDGLGRVCSDCAKKQTA